MALAVGPKEAADLLHLPLCLLIGLRWYLDVRLTVTPRSEKKAFHTRELEMDKEQCPYGLSGVQSFSVSYIL